MSSAFWLDLGVGAGALLALALLFNGGRHIWRRRPMRGCSHGVAGLIVGLIVAAVLLVGLNLLTYARFTSEQPIGTICFVKLAQQRYAATFKGADGQVVNTALAGDQWELDARIIKWTGLATELGLQPLYRLDRLSGRYADIHQARTRPRSIVALSNDPGIDLYAVARKQAGWLPLVDAAYGSGTYLPMADGAAYRISLSFSGLLARPANAAAERAVGQWH
jgi:hypothetical protein